MVKLTYRGAQYVPSQDIVQPELTQVPHTEAAKWRGCAYSMLSPQQPEEAKGVEGSSDSSPKLKWRSVPYNG